MAGLAMLLLSAAGWAWEYHLGQSRHQQQANFCDSKNGALEIIRVFTSYGARTGYSALGHATDCSTRIETFTPLRILSAVTISTGEPNQYTLYLTEVDIEGGSRSYLLTTREVHEYTQN